MYLTLRQSIKLLIIEHQKGHKSYEERAHFLVLKKGGHRTQVPSLCSAAPDHGAIVHLKKKKLANSWALGSSGIVEEVREGLGNVFTSEIPL